ncbi:CRIM domain-containing protein [Mycena kentingensis (nom. inval.)]|nr:CRIM domain-containing protein [Mycena kentingensis (nom. inval.)]
MLSSLARRTLDDSARRSGPWPSNESTLFDGSSRNTPASTSAPVRDRRRFSLRHSTPAFSYEFDIPENPLYAAMGLESVLEHPPSPTDDAGHPAAAAYSILDFSRRRVGAICPHDSALTAALAQATARPNPFDAAVAAGGDAEGTLRLRVCFPHAHEPVAQAMALSVPQDATVEDVIARALSTYWVQRWLPALDERAERDVDVGQWVMLVPGKDGVVEKRIACAKISQYKYDLFTIVRKPTTHEEKRHIQKQIRRFDLLSPPPLVQHHKPTHSHGRNYSMPTHVTLSSRPRNVDGPLSYSRLP